jgi:hypothetical protein
MKVYLKVENQLFVFVGGGHLFEGFKEGVCVELGGGEGDEACSSVVGEKDEDVIIGSRLENSSGSFSLDGCCVTFQDGEEVVGSDVALGIVDLDAGIDIDALLVVGGLVENFAFEGVVGVVSEVVVSESDDLVGIEAALDECLIGMVDIGLMSVVGPGVGASYEDGPVVTEAQS